MTTRLASSTSLYGRVRTVVRRDGVARTAERALGRLAAPLFERGALVLFVRDLCRPVPTAPAPAGFRVREAAAVELERILDGSDPERTADDLRDRFRCGHQCWVVESPSGSFAHVRWVMTEDPYIPEVRRCLILAPGDAYFYDGFTAHRYRRLGLDSVMRCAIFDRLKAGGFRRAVSYVRADNPAGLRAARRVQETAGRVDYVRLGHGVARISGTATIEPLRFAQSDLCESDEAERGQRELRWRQWFEGWTRQPLARRATGWSALPEDYFVASADFIAERLALDARHDRVLDLGCASAGISRELAGRCRHLVGADAVVGMLRDAERAEIRTATAARALFVGSDGRVLPFASGAFDKVYCTGMIHTLPSLRDAMRVVSELLRVCAPGGRILLGAIPDRRRRFRARLELLRRGDRRARLEAIAALAVPARLRSALRRLVGGSAPALRYLELDLEELRRRLELAGYACQSAPFPVDFWSRDFRTTRGNLLITVPVATAFGARSAEAAPSRFDDVALKSAG